MTTTIPEKASASPGITLQLALTGMRNRENRIVMDGQRVIEERQFDCLMAIGSQADRQVKY